jgi:hypothetical protein
MLSELRSLRASQNSISCVPADIGCLKALTLLDLTGNKLRVLPATCGEMRALRYCFFLVCVCVCVICRVCVFEYVYMYVCMYVCILCRVHVCV